MKILYIVYIVKSDFLTSRTTCWGILTGGTIIYGGATTTQGILKEDKDQHKILVRFTNYCLQSLSYNPPFLSFFNSDQTI